MQKQIRIPTTIRALGRQTAVTAMVLATSSTVFIAPAMAQEHAQNGGDVVASQQKESQGHLDWALRESFLRHIGGASDVRDGATKTYLDGSNGDGGQRREDGYRFQLSEATFNPEGNVTTAQFAGTVEYFEYCEGREPAEGNCSLELRIANPKVVLSDAESYVLADVRSKQHPSGEIFEKKGARIAEINPALATMEVVSDEDSANGNGSVVKWNNLATNLAEDGVNTFSGFYDLGSPLANMSFSYRGEGGVPAGANDGVKLLGNHRTEVEADNGRLLTLGKHAAIAGREAVEIVDATTMQKVGHFAIKDGANVLVSGDGHGRLVFADGDEIKTVTVREQGLGEIKTLGVIGEGKIAGAQGLSLIHI